MGRKFVASRSPVVMVPVLSRMRVWTSPAASTAFPDVASTLKRIVRSMPAMPIAERSAPIVVGIERDEQGDQIGNVDPRVKVGGDRRDGGNNNEEDQRQD